MTPNNRWAPPSWKILHPPLMRNRSTNSINLTMYTINKVFPFVFSQGWCCNPMHVGRTRMVKDTSASHNTFGMKTWSLTSQNHILITKAQSAVHAMSIQKRL